MRDSSPQIDGEDKIDYVKIESRMMLTCLLLVPTSAKSSGIKLSLEIVLG